MTETVTADWNKANQRYLVAALALLKHRLERSRQDASVGEDQQSMLQHALREAEAALPAPASLTTLCETFRLSAFEREVLLLCAGVELDGQLAAVCAAAQGYPGRQSDEGSGQPGGAMCPTFGLALAMLPDAHWDALTPGAPLRSWHLVEMSQGNLLTTSPLHIDEYVLHYLVGAPCIDSRLAHLVTTIPSASLDDLVPSQRVLAERLVAVWSRIFGASPRSWLFPCEDTCRQPVVQLCGRDMSGKYAIAAAASDALGLRLRLLTFDVLPTAPQDVALVIRLWERTAALGGEVLLLDCSELDLADSARVSAVIRLVQQLRAPLVVASRERLALPGLTRPVQLFEVSRPAPAEQRGLWRSSLAACELNGQIDQLVAQFHLSASTIRATASSVLNTARAQDEPGELLWEACRVQARPMLDALAQRIEPRAGWDDLVLPAAQQQLLHEIVAQVRQRATVYETWNFRPGGARGLGISALFAGASGTGKTLAAEVMSGALRLDLYRVDLSAVVSKYIGETEKNLRRVFDAAEEGGVVLLFDEADALFGKRGEVKDSHDRYANIEVSYLLQRMEEYRGLAILTTNFKQALDTAFLRRIRFVVQFPFPDVTQRVEIWRRIFSASLPTSGLDIQQLARLNIAGGNIRNIALNAAFLAAEAGEAVQMKHLLRAAGVEYVKIEKPLTEAEIGGWV